LLGYPSKYMSKYSDYRGSRRERNHAAVAGHRGLPEAVLASTTPVSELESAYTRSMGSGTLSS
jgi:hypothetical protein